MKYLPHNLHIVFIVCILIFCGCYKAEKQISNRILDLSETYQKLLINHNKERANKSLSLLVPNDTLTFYAQNHAEVMASRDKLYHSDISDLLGRFGLVGENIAFGQENEETVVDSWMHSTGHRANILNAQFTQVGFGVAEKNNRLYWVTVFAN